MGGDRFVLGMWNWVAGMAKLMVVVAVVAVAVEAEI